MAKFVQILISGRKFSVFRVGGEWLKFWFLRSKFWVLVFQVKKKNSFQKRKWSKFWFLRSKFWFLRVTGHTFFRGNGQILVFKVKICKNFNFLVGKTIKILVFEVQILSLSVSDHKCSVFRRRNGQNFSFWGPNFDFWCFR